MNLGSSTVNTISWANSVLGEFIRVRPWTTISVLFTAALGRIFNLAAFFLPLKVILLVGSEGVPRYFQGFIQPEDRDAWIIAIAVAAILSYVFYLMLERLSVIASESASQDVLKGANVLTIFNTQDDIARDAYSKICSIYSSLLFVLVIGAIGAWFNPWFFLVVLALIVLEYLLTSFFVRGSELHTKGTIKGYVIFNLGGYLQILSSVTFLASFMYMLLAFLEGQMTNILIAILSILIARQSLGALAVSIKQLADLKRTEQRINTLVFRHEKLKKQAPGELVALAHYFVEQNPLKVLAQLAHSNRVDVSLHSIEWGDPKVQGIYNFSVYSNATEEGALARSELQVFSPSRTQLRRNEELLFSYLDRKVLAAPPLKLKGDLPPFSIQLVGENIGRSMPKRGWPEVFKELLFRIKGLQPPQGLVDAYAMSKPLLGDRINSELLSRLEVAVQNDGDRQLLDASYAMLEEIQSRLSALPLCIDNPDLTRGKVVSDGKEEEKRIMNWGRWELAPLGAGELDMANSVDPGELLAHVRSVRTDVDPSVTDADLELAARCSELEIHTSRKHLQKSLRTLRQILDVF